MANRLVKRLAAALCLLTWVTSAGSQDYPLRPIRLVIPFAPAGTFDFVGRVIAPVLTENLGQQVVVDNRPGGGTVLATEIVARASPDGYTLLLGSNVLSINPSIKKNLSYNTEKDLVPIALLATQAFAIGASNSFSGNSVEGLINIARKKPREIAFGSAGLGSTGHIAAELFMSMAKVSMIHVGYKSGGQSVAAVLGNEIPIVFTGLPNVYRHMKAGRMKILGITELARSEFAPEIPTVAETLPGYEFSNWFGVLAPSGTPPAVLARIERELLMALQNPDVRKRLLQSGFGIVGASNRGFASTLKADMVKYAKIIKEAGIKPTF